MKLQFGVGNFGLSMFAGKSEAPNAAPNHADPIPNFEMSSDPNSLHSGPAQHSGTCLNLTEAILTLVSLTGPDVDQVLSSLADDERSGKLCPCWKNAVFFLGLAVMNNVRQNLNGDALRWYDEVRSELAKGAVLTAKGG